MNRAVRMAGVLAAVMVLGGCAGTADSDQNESLADYIGFSPFGDDHDAAVHTAKKLKYTDEEKKRNRAVEDFTVSCMRDEGFEYIPQYLEDLENDPPGIYEIRASMSREEFAKQYGYGYSTLMFAQKPSEPNPNTTIREALSPEAGKAYDMAFFGEDGNGGCHAKANKEAGGNTFSEMEQIANEFKGLQEDLSRLQQRLVDDPQMREATKKWADCMADGGYPGLEQAVDPTNLIDERLRPILPQPPDTQHEPVDQKKLKEVQDFELAIAVVDFACTQEHITPVRKEVATRLDKQFVAEHKAELERFRARAGDSGYEIVGPA